MYRTTRFAAPVLALGALVSSTSAVNASVAWSTPSGSNSLISYNSGQSDYGLFGDPTVNGSTFLFFPSNFSATASNGAAATTSDRLSFKVNAAPGKFIQKVNITELGDFSITGGGSSKAFGTLYITRLNSPSFGQVLTNTLTTTYYDSLNNLITPRPSTSGSLDGTWDGKFAINLPSGTTSVQVVLNNVLQATSLTGGTSFIQKKVLGGPQNSDDPQFVVDVIVPEPTTASLAIMGGAGFLLRRRRRPVTTS